MAKQLIERTVQTVALKYMVNHYKWRARRNRVWNKIETRTRKKYGGKRADGLLAYKKRFGRGVFVASMEAKSYKTQDAITPRRDTWRWVKNSLYWGSMIALGSGAIFAYKMMDNPIQAGIYIANLWLALVLIVALVTRNANFNRTMPVYNQICQYPANEQWISISKDSYDDIPKNLRKPFVKVLKARGIGLLIVNPRKNIHCVHKPKRRRKFFGDFLKYYSLEDDIRKYL